MARKRRMIVCLLSAVALPMIVGCPDARTNNQGGGSVLTVASKIQINPSDPPIGELNPDEWQIVTDNLPTLIQISGLSIPADLVLPSLTDEQAQDLADFLDANGITNFSQLSTLADDVLMGNVQIPPSLMEFAAAIEAQLFSQAGA